MNSLKKGINAMELDLEKEMAKLKKKENLGIGSKQKNKVENSEMKHMGKVLDNKDFQTDPLSALKLHISNNLSN